MDWEEINVRNHCLLAADGTGDLPTFAEAGGLAHNFSSYSLSFLARNFFFSLAGAGAKPGATVILKQREGREPVGGEGEKGQKTM